MLKKFDHVAIPVRSIERSLAFYRDILGLKITETHGPDITFVGLGDGQASIMLRRRAEVTPFSGHLCFEVGSAAAVKGELEAKGVKGDDLYTIPGVGQGVDVYDPDGHMVSLIDLTGMK